MDRIFESNALANTPPAPPANPSSGYPTSGNPGTDTPPTNPGAWWYYMVTEEMRTAIASAGLTPDHQNLNQLSQALATLQRQQTHVAHTTLGNAPFFLVNASNLTTLATPLRLRVKFHTAGMGSDTLNINSLGAKSLVKYNSAGAKVAATVAAGQLTDVEYDGTDWVVLNPLSDIPAGTIHYFAGTTAPNGYLKANGTVVSRSTYATLYDALVTAAGFSAQTFTVTMGSPAVFTKPAHDFKGGERLRLSTSTSGALPTNLSNATDYFVERINNETFYLSASPYLGTRVGTSGSQSGTHSYLQSWFGLGDGSTTFNVPDLRGEFIRGWADDGSVDTARVLGSGQGDAFKSHTHNISSNATNGNAGIASVYSSVSAATYSNTTDIKETGGAETRPRNVALLACIKY